MTGSDKSKGGRSRDEVLAGEYVLGVLDSETSRKVEERMRRDRQFAAIVWRWEKNLAQIDDTRGEDAKLRQTFVRMEERLLDFRRQGVFGLLWHSLTFWRGVAISGLFGLAVFIAFTTAPGLTPEPAPLLARMSGENQPVALLARYDERGRRLKVAPVAAGQAAEKSLELWLIAGTDPPKSLGVLPQSGEGEIEVPAGLRLDIAAGAVFAVSLEPAGGSPTGEMTGPVLARGTIGF
ncbi:anti-sigma factor [Pseudomonas sp. R2.Fl]|nr:anti-sigma factor [Pseudomonas sp. R2.Fl]